MNQELIMKTYDVIDEIKSSKTYKRMQILYNDINSNEMIIEFVKEFNKAKIKFEETSKYGKYHPDLKDAQKNLLVAKEKLYTNDIVKEYKACEKEIQSILNSISKDIAQAVSYKIKHPNDLGLVNKH